MVGVAAASWGAAVAQAGQVGAGSSIVWASTVLIPARSFLHLATQDEQIACLRNIRRHLRDDGTRMLNFFTRNLPALLRHLDPDPEFAEFGRYPHPEGKGEILVSFRQVNELAEQIQRITWRFEVDGQVHESPMLVRWIYKAEFELLARLGGFSVRHLYSGFQRLPYRGDGEMVWVLDKRPGRRIAHVGQRTAS